jgi:hypothetical protein
MKGKHKKSVTLFKDLTCKSWAIKKENKRKPKVLKKIKQKEFPIQVQKASLIPNGHD